MSRRFLFLLVLFIIGTAVQSWVFPPMEGSDEPLHTAYVAYLRAERTLPERTTYLENCTRQQSGQPPLVYVTAALLLDVLRAPNPGCDAIFDYYFGQTDNRWLLTPNPFRRDDNNTNFLPVTSSIAPPTGMPAALHIIRLTSVVFGALAVIGAYLAAGEVFKRETWRLTAAAVFAFTPTLFHVSAYFSNDPAAAAFTTLVMWRVLHLMNHGVTVRRLLIVGALTGVGALAKASVVLVLVPIALAVTVMCVSTSPLNPLFVNREGTFIISGSPSLRAGKGLGDGVIVVRQIIVHGLWIALPVALTFGLWVLWGALTYGDPLGTHTHIHPVLNYDPPRPWADTLRTLPDVYLTYVGLLGYANVYMHPITYAALTVVVVLAVIGCAVRVRGKQGTALSLHSIVLAVLWLTVFMGFLRWYRTIFDVTGRLLLPAHLAFVLFVTAGIAALATRFPRMGYALHLGSVGVFIAAGGLATFTSLNAAYAPRLLTESELPPLQGTPYDFDETIRLLGYHHESGVFYGELDTITVCWEVLQPTDRLAAYAVRYVKDGVQAANRTTVHGLGKYNSTLWQAGAIFCDAVDMPIGDPLFGGAPPEAGATYDILVVLLDVQTLDVNWQATTLEGTPVQFPILGQLQYVSQPS